MAENLKLQKQVLKKAVREPIFSKDVLPRIPTSIFEVQKYKDMVLIIKRYYQKHNEALTEDVLSTLVEERLHKDGRLGTDQEDEYFEFVSTLFDVKSQDDGEVIDEKIESFIKQELRRELFYEYTSKTEDDVAMEEFDRKMRDVMTMDINGNNRQVINLIDDSERKAEALRSLGQNLISTGYEGIDAACDGGVGRGELAMVIAKSGSGKTSFMINLATNYTKKLKKNVLFIALEELENRMVLKFDQTLMGRKKSEIVDKDGLNEAFYTKLSQAYSKYREKMFGNLYFTRFSPKTITPNKIEQIISDVQLREGIDLDAVIVDYPDLLRNPNATGDVSEDGGDLFHSMRRIAQEQDVIMWTASQANRAAFSAELLTSEHIEGALKKKNACELVVTINQTKEEFSKGYLRLYFEKVRNRGEGTQSEILLMRIDVSTLRIKEVHDQGELSEHQELLEQADAKSFGNKRKYRQEQSQKQEEKQELMRNFINQKKEAGAVG